MSTNDPFEGLNLEEELNPDTWEDWGTTLRTPTFTAWVGKVIDTPRLHLSKSQFAGEEIGALTRFLVDQGLLPPDEPSRDISDIHPQRVDE